MRNAQGKVPVEADNKVHKFKNKLLNLIHIPKMRML